MEISVATRFIASVFANAGIVATRFIESVLQTQDIVAPRFIAPATNKLIFIIMIRKIFLVFILFMGVLAAVAQTCTLRFTGTDNQRQHYVKLDHVNIFNKTQLWQEVIYWPDTTLVLGGTGLDEYGIEKGYRIMQNTPNPFSGSTEFAITLPQERSVLIEIFDITGKKVVAKSFGMLEADTHIFNVTLQTPNTYIANATIKDGQMTINMINEGHGAANEISYAGMRGMSEIKRGKGERYVESYPFAAGNMMEYTGFAVIDGVECQSAVVEQPQHASATIKLVFTLGVPTVATLGVSYIGNYSATVSGNVTDDGGAEVTARGICWSTTQNPTVSNSHIANGSGIGTFTAVINNFSPSTTYYVRAYATNSAGTAYGSQVSFTTLGDGQPCPATPTVTDIDGNVYNTVQIGEQCWMRENLRTTHYSDGTAIAYGSTSSTTTAYRYYPNNSYSNVATFGYLYNWKAVMCNSSSSDAIPSGVQGICPNGWHVPSDAEWMQLIDYVGLSGYGCENNNSNIAKALAATTGWYSSSNSCAVGNNQSANNTTGFSALPAGSHFGSSFNGSGTNAYFWSSTEYSSSDAYYRRLGNKIAYVTSNYRNKGYGYSVRCLRD